MSEQTMDKKEFALWLIVAVLIATVLLSPVACTINRHRLIAEAIRNGADPIAAKCAIESENGHSIQCVIRAQQK